MTSVQLEVKPGLTALVRDAFLRKSLAPLQPKTAIIVITHSNLCGHCELAGAWVTTATREPGLGAPADSPSLSDHTYGWMERRERKGQGEEEGSGGEKGERKNL